MCPGLRNMCFKEAIAQRINCFCEPQLPLWSTYFLVLGRSNCPTHSLLLWSTIASVKHTFPSPEQKQLPSALKLSIQLTSKSGLCPESGNLCPGLRNMCFSEVIAQRINTVYTAHHPPRCTTSVSHIMGRARIDVDYNCGLASWLWISD